MLDVSSRALGVEIERVTERSGRFDFKQGRAQPGRGASEIDEFRGRPAGDEINDRRGHLLLAQPLGELVHTLALIAHLEVDPEPGSHDRCRVDVVVDLKGSGEDIEEIQGLPIVLHDPWGILLHADDQPYMAVSLFRHVAREIGGFARRCMVSDAAVDVPARFAFATMLDIDFYRRIGPRRVIYQTAWAPAPARSLRVRRAC